jgi:hypothetical protein
MRTVPVPEPSDLANVKSGRHANGCLHLLKPLYGVNHLIASTILLDDPIDEAIQVAPAVAIGLALPIGFDCKYSG